MFFALVPAVPLCPLDGLSAGLCLLCNITGSCWLECRSAGLAGSNIVFSALVPASFLCHSKVLSDGLCCTALKGTNWQELAGALKRCSGGCRHRVPAAWPRRAQLPGRVGQRAAAQREPHGAAGLQCGRARRRQAAEDAPGQLARLLRHGPHRHLRHPPLLRLCQRPQLLCAAPL